MHTRRTATPKPPESMRQPDVRRPSALAPISDPLQPTASAELLARALLQRAKTPGLPGSAVNRFRVEGPEPAPISAGRGRSSGLDAVFRSPQEAAATASVPGERVVPIRSVEARQRARRLVELSPGEPLDSAIAARLKGQVGNVVDDVTVHEDNRAQWAAQLLGAHAFALGERVFLGATVDTPDGPSRMQALRHEVTHIAQGTVGARGGRIASAHVLEGQAQEGVGELGLERDLLGADPDEIREWLWIPALIAAGYILLDPDPANAPGPGDRTYKRKPSGQRIGEAISLALPLGMLGRTPTLLRAAAAGATSQVGYTAAGDIGQGRYSGTGVYLGRGATGAVLWMIPVPPLRQYAAGATGVRLWGSFAGAGAVGGVSLRALGDINQRELSPLEDYLWWGVTGTGIGLAGAGGVRALDFLSTRGAVASDIIVSETIAGQVPAGASSVESAMAAAPWWGRASHAYLGSRNWVVLYRGQGAMEGPILSPLARGPGGGIAASEEMLAQLRTAGLTEEQIAGLTAKYGPEVLPRSFMPPELQGLGGKPIGGAGIPTSRLPGVAADYASAYGAELTAQGLATNPAILIIRAPAGAPVPALQSGWGAKSLVEQEYVIFHQIPGGWVVQRMPPTGLPYLRASYEAGKDVLVTVPPGTPRVR